MRNQKGFTLIEVIIYLALFSMLFGGIVLAAYNVIDSSGRSQVKAMIQEEGDFLVSKINWVLSGVQSVSEPSTTSTSCDTGVASTFLSVAKFSPPIANPLAVALSGTDMTLSQGSNAAQILNNSSVQVSNLAFVYAQASGDGLVPESVCSTFTLSVKTPTGQTISQDFSTTNFLRQ